MILTSQGWFTIQTISWTCSHVLHCHYQMGWNHCVKSFFLHCFQAGLSSVESQSAPSHKNTQGSIQPRKKPHSSMHLFYHIIKCARWVTLQNLPKLWNGNLFSKGKRFQVISKHPLTLFPPRALELASVTFNGGSQQGPVRHRKWKFSCNISREERNNAIQTKNKRIRMES